MNGNEGSYGQLSWGLKLISLEVISYGHIITKLCLYLYIAYLLSTLGQMCTVIMKDEAQINFKNGVEKKS